MTTVSDVIERVYRDYLLPPDEQPARLEVGSGGITDSATTLPVDATILSPEEQDLIGPGALIEVVATSSGVVVGGELMLVKDVTGDPPTSLDVRRGMFGTTERAAVAGDDVYLAPDFPRQEVFDAVADSIEALWPDLWTVVVEETYANGSPVELPAEVEEILEVRVANNGRWDLIGGWELLTDYPLASTGKAVQFRGWGNGEAIHVKYRAAPTRPAAEADKLSDLHVSDTWVKAIAVGAAAHVFAGEDIDAATVAFITEALEAEGFSVGAGADVRNSLLQYQDFLMRPLVAGLEARTRTTVVIDHVF